MNKLPLLLTKIPIFIAHKSVPNNPNEWKKLIINGERILWWLVFLKNNNEHYKDIEINYPILSTLPMNGFIFYSLGLYADNNEEEVHNLEVGEGGLELGPV